MTVPVFSYAFPNLRRSTRLGWNARRAANAWRWPRGVASAASTPPLVPKLRIAAPAIQISAPTPLRNCPRYRTIAIGRLASSMRAPSGRVDDAHADHPQRGHARHEEVLAAARLDELWHAGADERRAGAIGVRLYDELGVRVVVAHDRAGVAAGIEVEPVLHPLLLHELELAKQARTNRQEDDAVLGVVRGVRAIDRTVWQSAPQNAAAVVERRTHPGLGVGRREARAQHIARVAPAEVRGDWTRGPKRVGAVDEVDVLQGDRRQLGGVARLFRGGQFGVEGLPRRIGRRRHKRDPVVPPPDQLGRDDRLGLVEVCQAIESGVTLALGLEIVGETGRVLVQLAIGHE